MTGAEHELRCVSPVRELDEGSGDVGAGNLVELFPDVLEQLAVLVEESESTAASPVLAGDIHAKQFTVGPLGDAGRPPDQPLGVGAPVTATTTRSASPKAW